MNTVMTACRILGLSVFLSRIINLKKANPGGGKDRVEFFIERAKNNVMESKQSLETVIRILDLKL